MRDQLLVAPDSGVKQLDMRVSIRQPSLICWTGEIEWFRVDEYRRARWVGRE